MLIGFALDQQVSVPTAFLGPQKPAERIGALDAKTIAAMDPDGSGDGVPGAPRDSSLPGHDGTARAGCAR